MHNGQGVLYMDQKTLIYSSLQYQKAVTDNVVTRFSELQNGTEELSKLSLEQCS